MIHVIFDVITVHFICVICVLYKVRNNKNNKKIINNKGYNSILEHLN